MPTKNKEKVVADKVSTSYTSEDLMKGLVCLDAKMDTLIGILTKMGEYVERRAKGTLS